MLVSDRPFAISLARIEIDTIDQEFSAQMHVGLFALELVALGAREHYVRHEILLFEFETVLLQTLVQLPSKTIHCAVLKDPRPEHPRLLFVRPQSDAVQADVERLRLISKLVKSLDYNFQVLFVYDPEIVESQTQMRKTGPKNIQILPSALLFPETLFDLVREIDCYEYFLLHNLIIAV